VLRVRLYINRGFSHCPEVSVSQQISHDGRRSRISAASGGDEAITLFMKKLSVSWQTKPLHENGARNVMRESNRMHSCAVWLLSALAAAKLSREVMQAALC